MMHEDMMTAFFGYTWVGFGLIHGRRFDESRSMD